MKTLNCHEITADCASHVDGEFVDRYEFWSEPPDEPSPRFAAWLDLTLAGECGRTGGGYDEDAEHMGVYLWESLNVLYLAERGPRNGHDIPLIRGWLLHSGLPADWLDG